jgi:hypothetical protein
MNHTLSLDYHFKWQRGYGALSIGKENGPGWRHMRPSRKRATCNRLLTST